jgi:hypothetical protein
MKRSLAIATVFALLAGQAIAYPLDGYEYTGINRLKVYDQVQDSLVKRGTLEPGSLLKNDQVVLTLESQAGWTMPAKDAELSAELKGLLGADAGGYGLAVLDLTKPANPVYAGHQTGYAQNPASVGKVMVALAFFQALADAHPQVEKRHSILHDTMITANDFIIKDSHDVVFWKPGDAKVDRRPIVVGDTASLYTYLDWMLSPSSSAAASMVQYQLVLVKHFGSEYPVSQARADEFFANTPKSELSKIFLDAIQKPLGRNGLDVSKLRQGSFFTRTGKSRVPGTNSTATAGELLKFVVLMEQGKLVDPWSSREMKRLLYLTERRARYASQPALNTSAVYYKSGSLYGCKPEKGFVCEKYAGNRMNFLNSMAIIESPEGLRYVVVLLSNVLRKNSAEQHKELAAQIHNLMKARHGVVAAP